MVVLLNEELIGIKWNTCDHIMNISKSSLNEMRKYLWLKDIWTNQSISQSIVL